MRALGLAALLALAACAQVPPFKCETDDQCGTGGLCESNHACSFADTSCRVGRRFGADDPTDVAGVCVGDESGKIATFGSGSDHSCAVGADGRVWCWGDNSAGNLGRDDVKSSSVPAAVVGVEGATDLDGGEYHTCAVADGAVWCWGRDDDQQLGDGDTKNRSEPRKVQGLDNVVDLDLGEQHSCARDAAGVISCWGRNVDHEAGRAQPDHLPHPLPVDVPPATSLACGGQNGCAITGEGVYCWGLNGNGQLGIGDVAVHDGPVEVPGYAGALQVVVGGGHTCALLGDGTVACAGANNHGQLGQGTAGSSKTTPVPVNGLTDIVELAALDWTTCARDRGGAVRCWGRNDVAQVGASGDDRLAPGDPVPLPRPAVKLSAGESHACAQTDDGCLWCWGRNTLGQLGAGVADTGNAVAPVMLACW